MLIFGGVMISEKNGLNVETTENDKGPLGVVKRQIC